jgi:hypothetical protein
LTIQLSADDVAVLFNQVPAETGIQLCQQSLDLFEGYVAQCVLVVPELLMFRAHPDSWQASRHQEGFDGCRTAGSARVMLIAHTTKRYG